MAESLSTQTPFQIIKQIKAAVCLVIGLEASRFAIRLASRARESALSPVIIALEHELADTAGDEIPRTQGDLTNLGKQSILEDGIVELSRDNFVSVLKDGYGKGATLRVRCDFSVTADLLKSLASCLDLVLFLDPSCMDDMERATAVAFSKLSERGVLMLPRSSGLGDDPALTALNLISRDWRGQIFHKGEYYLLPTPGALPDLRKKAKAVQRVRTRELVLPFKFLEGPLTEIRDARIFGSDWDALVPGQGVIWNPVSHKRWFTRRLSKTQCVLTYSHSSPPRRWSQSVVVIGGFHNFYHHLVDYMSRLFTIGPRNDDWHYALYEDRSSFHSQMRHFFEIPDERTLFFPRDGIPVHCDRAIMAPPAVVKRGRVVDLPALTRMREFAAAKTGVSAKKTDILISRRYASKRRIENEDELYERLSQRGFINVSLEKLSFSEQVKLFANARTIVAPHGAGLGSIVFAPPGAEIIELTPSLGAREYFVNLAKGCGHNLTRVQGFPSTDDVQFRVDVDMVANTLHT